MHIVSLVSIPSLVYAMFWTRDINSINQFLELTTERRCKDEWSTFSNEKDLTRHEHMSDLPSVCASELPTIKAKTVQFLKAFPKDRPALLNLDI